MAPGRQKGVREGCRVLGRKGAEPLAVGRLFAHNGFVAKGVRAQRSDLGYVWRVAGEGPAFGVDAAVATGVHPRDVTVAGFKQVLETWEQPAHGGGRLLDDGNSSSA